ncbi:MAG TPA: carbonic anhydrase [Ktedonobacterales bacterium]
MQVEHLFVGVISCFDARATNQARAWARERFAPEGAVIDLITSLAPERVLAGAPSAEQEGLRAQIIHAAETHGITDWVLAAHAGCEAGEAAMAETLARLAAAASALRGWGVPARRVAAIYMDGAGMVEEMPIYG